MTEINIKKLYDVKSLIKDELDTIIIIDKYKAIYAFCSIYETWCLKKKAKQIKDITKKERFDVTVDLLLKISERIKEHTN